PHITEPERLGALGVALDQCRCGLRSRMRQVHSELHRSFSRAGLQRIGDALPDRRVPGSQLGDRSRRKGHNALTTAETKGEAMRFTGKVAVITAYANGIGRAAAEIMAREGAVV